MLNGLHYRKIDMSDAIFVVTVGGYMGEATQKKIEHARARDKEVIFLCGSCE